MTIVWPLICGCSGSSEPPYEISGTVTFEGQPVPVGFIHFMPDSSRGNSGSAGGAPIQDGKYVTASGKGTVGGPHRVEIEGFDDIAFDTPEGPWPDGKPLFPRYRVEVDLPKSATTKDFDVPTPTDSGTSSQVPRRQAFAAYEW